MKLRTKIICGYTTILAITCMGTTTGFLVGNNYQRKALENREIASRERKLINQLQIDILYNRPAKQLSPYLDKSQEFKRASTDFQNRLIRIKILLANHNNSGVPASLPGLQFLLEEYETKVDKFNNKLTQTVVQIEPLTSSPSPQESIRAKELIIQLVRGKEFVEFIEFPDQLAEYAQMAQSWEEKAEVNLARAERLRTQIIVASLLISIPVAALLSFYISQAITKPLSAVTKVAQRVTKDSNFDLQATVTTKDEIGILATTFNQMVVWIKNYTDQLEKAQQTLEEKVAERTQALNQTLQKLRQTQAHMIQAEKMSGLGQMVAGIAHEINNPMSFVYTNLAHLEQYNQDLINLVTLYEQEYPCPTLAIKEEIETIDLEFLIEDIPSIFNSMKVGSQRVHKIVESLRNFSHLDEEGLKSVDIHQGINNTILLLRKRLEDKPGYQKIELIKNYSPLPLIDCYPSQINQVFFYLLSNAIDSLDEYNQHRLPADIATNPSMIEIITKQIDSDWIAVEIIDNGLGIPPEIHSKIFDPFFTTKPVGKGTGLGLSISYQIIVEKHRGMILCNSVPEEGTIFIIKLPIESR